MKHETDTIPVSKLTDPDMQAVTAALMRAARRAHLIAHQTGTGVVVMRAGKVVEVEPDPEMYEVDDPVAFQRNLRASWDRSED